MKAEIENSLKILSSKGVPEKLALELLREAVTFKMVYNFEFNVSVIYDKGKYTVLDTEGWNYDNM